jgi:hypothetical protein
MDEFGLLKCESLQLGLEVFARRDASEEKERRKCVCNLLTSLVDCRWVSTVMHACDRRIRVLTEGEDRYLGLPLTPNSDLSS